MLVCFFNDVHLSHSILSLKKQSIKTDIVVVDDGSTLEYRKVYSNIDDLVILRISKNLGIGHARNVGLNYALKKDYDYIGFLDSDGIAHFRFIETALSKFSNNQNMLGVCARKDVANSYIRVARIKYRYKIFKRDDFQLDCSLFRRRAFEKRIIPNRRSGEDSVFILSFEKENLSKLIVPYYHFERENLKEFFRDEYYGTYQGYKPDFSATIRQFLLTPLSSLKMILKNGWILEGLLFPFRQTICLIGYLMGNR